MATAALRRYAMRILSDVTVSKERKVKELEKIFNALGRVQETVDRMLKELSDYVTDYLVRLSESLNASFGTFGEMYVPPAIALLYYHLRTLGLTAPNYTVRVFVVPSWGRHTFSTFRFRSGGIEVDVTVSLESMLFNYNLYRFSTRKTVSERDVLESGLGYLVALEGAMVPQYELGIPCACKVEESDRCVKPFDRVENSEEFSNALIASEEVYNEVFGDLLLEMGKKIADSGSPEKVVDEYTREIESATRRFVRELSSRLGKLSDEAVTALLSVYPQLTHPIALVDEACSAYGVKCVFRDELYNFVLPLSDIVMHLVHEAGHIHLMYGDTTAGFTMKQIESMRAEWVRKIRERMSEKLRKSLDPDRVINVIEDVFINTDMLNTLMLNLEDAKSGTLPIVLPLAFTNTDMVFDNGLLPSIVKFLLVQPSTRKIVWNSFTELRDRYRELFGNAPDPEYLVNAMWRPFNPDIASELAKAYLEVLKNPAKYKIDKPLFTASPSTFIELVTASYTSDAVRRNLRIGGNQIPAQFVAIDSLVRIYEYGRLSRGLVGLTSSTIMNLMVNEFGGLMDRIDSEKIGYRTQHSVVRCNDNGVIRIVSCCFASAAEELYAETKTGDRVTIARQISRIEKIRARDLITGEESICYVDKPETMTSLCKCCMVPTGGGCRMTRGVGEPVDVKVYDDMFEREREKEKPTEKPVAVPATAR